MKPLYMYAKFHFFSETFPEYKERMTIIARSTRLWMRVTDKLELQPKE